MKIKIACLALIVCSNLFGQQFKFPKKIQLAVVAIPETQMMVGRYEESVGDWFAFVYNKYYDEENLQFKDGYEKVMPDSNLMPQKYAFAIRVFSRLMHQPEQDFVHFYGTNCFQYYYLPLYASERENTKGQSSVSMDELSDGARLQRILYFPMVGVSYDQVQLYLNWRKELAQNDKAVMKKKYSVNARLMTKEEWGKYASDLGPHFSENHTIHIDSINALGCYLLKVQESVPCKNSAQAISLFKSGAVPVYGYFPDRLGLFCMFGNVWEMTQEKGIAIGGSYADFANRCDASISLSYTGPQENLGFRCVLEFSQAK